MVDLHEKLEKLVPVNKMAMVNVVVLDVPMHVLH